MAQRMKKMLDYIKAVLFDLDGTLVDSMWVWKQIDMAFLKKRHIPMPQGLQQEIEGMSMKETAVYFRTRFLLSESVEELMEEWNEMAMDVYRNQVSFKPGGEAFLRYLRSCGIKTGICTSNSRELLHAVAEKLKLPRYIDVFLTANEVAHGKPAPDIYLEAAARLCVSPEECLVFEDIIPGIEAGRNAGMKVCTIADAYSAGVWKEKQRRSDYCIEDYTRLPFLAERCIK